jgi:hypothetical protein
LKADSENFYFERDGRTDLVSISSDYQEVGVHLAIDPEWAKTYSGQVALVVAGNLLSRWCRDVIVHVPDVALEKQLRRGEGRLIELVLNSMRSADPYGRFELGEAEHSRLKLYLGPNGPSESGWSHAFGDGWGAFESTRPLNQSKFDAANPIGAMGAACLGVASVFMRAVGYPSLWADPLFIDFFNLSPVASVGKPFPRLLELGRTLVVGAGAVGSSLLYLLTFLPSQGHILIVDHDPVKALNLNRSLLQFFQDIGQNKAQVAVAYLKQFGVSAEAYPESYKDFLKNGGSLDVDLVIPAANEFNVRWDLASGYSPLMIYGTTDANWGAYLGRHIPLFEECISCRFPKATPVESMACATAPLPHRKDNDPDAALPFLSPLSAVMALAEICKLQLPGYPFHGNRAQLDLGGFPQRLHPYTSKAKEGCGACESRRAAVFRSLRSGSRWSFLSN